MATKTEPSEVKSESPLSLPGGDDFASSPAPVPETPTKKKTPAKRTPASNKRKAATDGGAEASTPAAKTPRTNAGDFSNSDVQLMVEVAAHIGSQIRNSGANISVDWKMLAEKLDLPSAGATSKRFERFLKHFDKKTSDITGKTGGKGRGKAAKSQEASEES